MNIRMCVYFKSLFLWVGVWAWSTPAFSQISFSILFGENTTTHTGRSVKTIEGGDIFFLGNTVDSLGISHIRLSRIDSLGNIRWIRTLDSLENYVGLFLHHSHSDASWVITGYRVDENGDSDAFLLEVDSSAAVQWHGLLGISGKQDQLKYVEPLASGGYISAGFITQPDLLFNDFLLVKWDNNGQPLWTNTFGFDDNDYAQMVRPTADGGYVISGDSKQHDYENYVVKTDSAGQLAWELLVGDEYVNGNQTLWINADGSYTLFGESTTPAGSFFDVYVANISSSGSLIDSHYMGGIGSDAAFSVTVNELGDYVFCGYSNSYNPNEPVNMVMGRMEGNALSVPVKYFPQPCLSVGYEIIPYLNHTYLIAGTGCNRFFLVRAEDGGYTHTLDGYSLGIAADFSSSTPAVLVQSDSYNFPYDNGNIMESRLFLTDMHGKNHRIDIREEDHHIVIPLGYLNNGYYCLNGQVGSRKVRQPIILMRE